MGATWDGFGKDDESDAAPSLLGGDEFGNLGSDLRHRLLGESLPNAPVTAVTFDKAAACGWVRGAIGGVTDASFQAVRLTTNANGCFVMGTDLSGNAKPEGEKVFIAPGRSYRLSGNLGSTQRSTVGLGAPIPVTISLSGTQGSIVPEAGFIALALPTSPTPPVGVALTIIDPAGSQAGGRSARFDGPGRQGRDREGGRKHSAVHKSADALGQWA